MGKKRISHQATKATKKKFNEKYNKPFVHFVSSWEKKISHQATKATKKKFNGKYNKPFVHFVSSWEKKNFGKIIENKKTIA